MTCPKCGPIRPNDEIWVVDHRGTQETEEEGHYECPHCCSVLGESDG